MTPERIAKLRSILKEGVRTDRPMKNFMNVYDAAKGLSEALDAIERVAAMADWHRGDDNEWCGTSIAEQIDEALEGKSDG